MCQCDSPFCNCNNLGIILINREGNKLMVCYDCLLPNDKELKKEGKEQKLQGAKE